MLKKNILLGVTGSIAAYKAAELANRLVKADFDVNVIMTKNACEFITPATFRSLTQRKVHTDMFENSTEWNVRHVSLAKAADVVVVAPATANIIGKYANGIADDLLSTTLLSTKSRIIIAPAMNTVMYENPAVTSNLALLKKRGCVIAEPRKSRLACGDTGKGALADVSTIFDLITVFINETRV